MAERLAKNAGFCFGVNRAVQMVYDLVEEGRANNAIQVLCTVWENVTLHEGAGYWYEMSDAFYYFYHIAHMAKHFENGGCGIRPFIDLWILDHMEGVDQMKRDELLEKGDLLKFAQRARTLSEVWFDAKEADKIIVLENGSIADIGTHDELASREGLYASLWAIQGALEDEFLNLVEKEVK